MKTLEEHRSFWAGIAKRNGWYREPFYVVTWLRGNGEIVDSVSYDGLDRDMSVPYR